MAGLDVTAPVTVSSVVLAAAGEPALVHAAHWAPGWWRFGHNDSYAARTGGGVVLVDPELVAEGETPYWGVIGEGLAAIVLTTDSHDRGAQALRERFGVPVWAPRCSELEFVPDHSYADGATLLGAIRAVTLCGVGQANYALIWRAPNGERVCFTGDALNGASQPQHPLYAELGRRAPGLYAGAGADHVRKVGTARFREALRTLLAEEFDVICGGHGVPVSLGARDALGRLLALDWETALADDGDVGVPLVPLDARR